LFLVIWYRWLHFEKVIDDLVAQAIYYRSLEQLQTYAKEIYIEDEEEFNTMVNFYPDLGMIVKHRETVVLKAQWLIDLFKVFRYSFLGTMPDFLSWLLDSLLLVGSAWDLQCLLVLD